MYSVATFHRGPRSDLTELCAVLLLALEIVLNRTCFIVSRRCDIWCYWNDLDVFIINCYWFWFHSG